ncbi:SDR family oxidoreductase [Loktanella sp. TSTF-M6]|uniref:SDR family oxidoreductase n=1 Tax=Loktanella gaetbuli TaxID=2881335 RepID=A0ABS8BW11_9RHOB|nr:NAD(P)-binding oxidoreductase [Loktanella gaetbuli]MCB5199932.1 SDR family oxidoreductase [Loktanella gaetbuli]
MTNEPKADVTIAVFGATGQTGRHVLNRALHQGHAVRALVRDPSKLHIEADRLKVIPGDFDNIAALRETVRGATHVICCAGGTYGKGYDTGMMTRFIARLWPVLDAEVSVRTFLFQSVFFVPEPDGSNPVILKLLAPVAAYVTGATEMLRDNTAVTTFIAAHRDVSFDTIVTRPGKIVDKPGGTPLVASQTPSFAAITFADLGAFTVSAVQDVALHGTHPFVVPKP